jgi:hypothetical protein
MAIELALLKFFQCLTWAEGDSHGGDIDLASEITSGQDQNIFDDVSNDERAAGDVEYRKIYIRNENADTWQAVKAWIAQFTPAANDEIEIKLGTPGGVQNVEGVAAGYVSPDTKEHADALAIGDLEENEYQAIWIKRTVTADGPGYTGNSFTIACESS